MVKISSCDMPVGSVTLVFVMSLKVRVNSSWLAVLSQTVYPYVFAGMVMTGVIRLVECPEPKAVGSPLWR